jgi:hypothetical protein
MSLSWIDATVHICLADPRVSPVADVGALALQFTQCLELLRVVASTMAGSSVGVAAVTVQHDAQPMVRLLKAVLL